MTFAIHGDARAAIEGMQALLSLSATPTWRDDYGQQNGAAAYAAGAMYVAPFLLPRRASIDGMSYRTVAPGTAGALGRCVLYSDSGSHAPSALLAQTVADDAATTGQQRGGLFTAITLEPGLYWKGVLITVAAASLMLAAGASNNMPALPWLTNPFGTGTLPAPPAGNQGVVFGYTSGLTAPPATFAGSNFTDKNDPKLIPWVVTRLAAA